MNISHRTQVGASAPGKIIFFGEHFVVYNSEAIVAAINRRCYGRVEFTESLGVRFDTDIKIDNNPDAIQHATKINGHANKELFEPLKIFCEKILKRYSPRIGLQIHIKSELPVGVGLGSSAAACVMLAGILRLTIAGIGNKELSSSDHKWVFENALKGEQLFHNKSSGVDCYVSTYGGLVRYRGLTETTSIRNQPLPLFFINTRKSHETSELVSHVRRFSTNKPKCFNRLACDASAICLRGVKAIENGSLEELGRLMTENHKLLIEIGVSNKEIEKIIDICIKYGSLGAKITGAGGGGCILLLARSETIPALMVALKDLNLTLEAIGIENKGLIID